MSKLTASRQDGRQPETTAVSRQQLIGLLNEDLARVYQAVIAYVVYSQVLNEQEHQIDLATALGENVPDVE
jgi:hypothetical protein